MTFYTEQQDATIREMHARGSTFSKIANEIGKSRNSVIGRARRLGLHAPKQEAKPTPPRASTGRKGEQCQWIAGDPSPDDSCKCLAPVEPGWPYCPEHLERAYDWGKARVSA